MLMVAASTLVAACEGGRKAEVINDDPAADQGRAAQQGRLVARPRRLGATSAQAGLQPLGLGAGRDGLVYVPAGHDWKRPCALVVMLHGAGSNAENALDPFRAVADSADLLFLAPESRERTWDVLLGGYGPDVRFIDQSLEWVFGRYNVDPTRVAIEGFSDGASYALGLGLTNGDLFRRVVAFSPGFVAPTRPHGMPSVFVSHGVADDVLPIARTSRRIVPQLQQDGYDVQYVEFEGGHTVPEEIAQEALRWLLADTSISSKSTRDGAGASGAKAPYSTPLTRFLRSKTGLAAPPDARHGRRKPDVS